MASNKNTEVEEVSNQEDGDGAEREDQDSIPLRLLLLIFAGFFIFTAASVSAVYFLLNKQTQDGTSTDTTAVASGASAEGATPAGKDAQAADGAKPAEADATMPAGKDGQEAEASASQESKPSENEGASAENATNTAGNHKKQANYLSIKPVFIINYQVNGRSHFLQVSVDVMSRSDAVLAAVEKNSPRIKNDLIDLFAKQDFEDLQTANGRDALRDQALRIVQKIIEEETGLSGVEEVLFTSFVIQ